MPITKLQSARDFFRIWFYWRRHASVLFLLMVGLTMFYAYTAAPRYESVAKVLVLPKTNEGEVISTGFEEKRISQVKPQDMYTEMELITNDEVLRETINSLDAQDIDLQSEERAWYYGVFETINDTLQELLISLKLKESPSSELESKMRSLEGSLHIESASDSNLIFVTIQSEKPAAATRVLNRLLKIYIKHRNSIFTKEEGLQFYNDQTEYYRAKLEGAESKMREFQKLWSIVDMARQNETNIQMLAVLEAEMKNIELGYAESKRKLDMLNKSLDETTVTGSDVLVTKEMRNIPAIVELEKGIVPVLIKRSEISKSFTKSSREYQMITSQIDSLRDEIRNEIRKAIRTDELELESLLTKRDSLEQQIDDRRQSAIELQQKEKELQELRRQVDLHKKSYLLYASKSEDAKIFSEKQKRDLANVTIASEATTPVHPVFPRRMFMLVMSVFVGLFAALAAPFVLESLDTKLKTVDDIETLLELQVVASFSETDK